MKMNLRRILAMLLLIFIFAGMLASCDASNGQDEHPESSGEVTTDGETTDGETTDGETTDGETTDGETTDGETTDGETTDGETTDGETTDGETTEGETTDGETTEGETTKEETTEGSTSGGDEPDYSAPDFVMLDENGNEVRLSDFFGKPIVLNFWATWCPYCVMELPDFNEAYLAHPDVQFIILNVTNTTTDTVEKAKAFIAEKGYDFPLFFDTERDGSTTYGASALPMSFFIDANGDLVTYKRGMIDADTLEWAISLIK